MASETQNTFDSGSGTPENQPEQPKNGIPVLPVRDTVLFPHAVLPLTVGRESSIQLINSLGEEKTILVVAQREARVDTPQPTDLYSIGTLATVHKVVKMPNQSLFVFTEGLDRAKLRDFTQLTPFLRANVDTIPDQEPDHFLWRRHCHFSPPKTNRRSWKLQTSSGVCKRSIATWLKNLRFSSLEQKFRLKCKIRSPNRSVSIICASR